LRAGDGEWRWVRDWNIALRDSNGDVEAIEGLVLDVSDRVAAEHRLEAAMASSPVAMLLLDGDGTIEGINEAAVALAGQSFPLGTSAMAAIEACIPEAEERKRALETMRRRMSGKNVPPQTYRFVNTNTGGGGVVRVHTVPYQSGYIVQLVDLTERHRLEKTVLDIAENERRRFGHDVHDVLGQDLAGLLFTASALRQRAQQDWPEAVADLEQLCSLISQSMRRTKKLARGMCLMGSEHLDLGDALEDLARETEELYGAACTAAVAGPVPELPSDVSSQLLQIAREGVLNAVRHAQADTIHASLAVDGRAVTLTIEDDGVGFCLDRDDGGEPGLGLQIMPYRAELAGARLSIDSIEGRGTRVRCTYTSAR
jgi:PAS domain S-box-containing protein